MAEGRGPAAPDTRNSRADTTSNANTSHRPDKRGNPGRNSAVDGAEFQRHRCRVRAIEEVVAVVEHDDSGPEVTPDPDGPAYIDQVRALEEEVLALRRRLQDAPKRVRTLEERLLETKGQLAQAVAQNEKLTYTLREARDHIGALREEVDKLTQPPSAYGTLLSRNDDGTVDVYSGGRKMRVAVHPDARRRRAGAGRRGRAERVAERRDGPHARDQRRGRHAQGDPRGRAPRHHPRARRRGARGRSGRRASSGRPCAPATRC